jgi:hypothetical protein
MKKGSQELQSSCGQSRCGRLVRMDGVPLYSLTISHEGFRELLMRFQII